MMVMLPGVVYRFTLSVSIWLFLPSVMYEVVTRGLTEPIDFCQQRRNCKNLIKLVGNFDLVYLFLLEKQSLHYSERFYVEERDPTIPNSGFTSSEKKKLLTWLLCMKDSTISFYWHISISPLFLPKGRTKNNCWVKKIGKMSLLASLLPVLLC